MENNHSQDLIPILKKIENSLETLYERNNFLFQQVPNNDFVKSHCHATNPIIEEIYDCMMLNKLSIPIHLTHEINDMFKKNKELSRVIVMFTNSKRKYNDEATGYLYITS